MEQRFLPLLVVVLLAFLAPLILARFKRIPVVVGEIFAGILIGPSVLGWVHADEPTLELLAEIGFAFLMFLSGLEIDFSILFAATKSGQDKWKSPLLLAGLTFLLTVILAGLASFWLTSVGFVKDPWMMTLILSTTSLGIVVPVLKERKMSGSRLGQTILLSALLADFLTMFFITVYIAIRSTGLGLDILLIVLLFVPMVFLYQLGERHLRRPIVRRLIEELSGATSQIKVRFAFALMISFVVLAELIGAELILGAFLAGVLASMLSEPGDERIREKLDAIGFGFFVPLFFVYVGIQFDLLAFIENPSAWILLPELLFAAFAIKLISVLVFRTVYSWKEVMASGMLLSARLSLIIAASAIGVRFGAISESTNADIILVAALTATIAPMGFNILMEKTSEKKRRVKVIFGESELARQVGKELDAHGDEVIYVGSLAENMNQAEGQKSEQGQSITEAISGVRVDAFLTLGSSDDENLDACRAARAQGVSHILAFVAEPIRVPDFRGLGVQTLTPSLHRSALLALMARNPAMFSLMTSTTDERDLREFVVQNTSLYKKRLMDLDFPANTLVLTIRRKDELIVPHGTTKLAAGDHLTILGEIDSLLAIEELLEG